MSDSVECCLCGAEIVGGEEDFGQWNKYSFWCPNEKCLLFDNELSMETWRALEQLQARVKELEAELSTARAGWQETIAKMASQERPAYDEQQQRIAKLEAINLGLTKTLVEMEAENTKAMREASSLAMSLWKRHYQEASPEFGLCDSVAGIISQIDNMTAGVSNDLKQMEAENAELRRRIREVELSQG